MKLSSDVDNSLDSSATDGTPPDIAVVAQPHQNPIANHPPTQSLTLKQEFGIFLSTFLTIFVAELGDKTQVTILLMSAESQSPGIVFLGAGAALIATSLVGVLVGRWLSNRVAPRTLETGVGGILLLISVLLLWDVVNI